MSVLGLTPSIGARVGAQFVGLDATPAGTDAAANAVADFTGSTQQDFPAPSTLTPITPTHSQTLGSTFKINVPGLWHVRFECPAATAASVLAAISIDGAAAELVVATAGLASGTRNMARARSLSTTADAHLLICEAMIRITKDLAYQVPTGVPVSGGIVRFILTNNAGGAAPAATLAPLAEARVIFDLVAPVSPE